MYHSLDSPSLPLYQEWQKPAAQEKNPIDAEAKEKRPQAVKTYATVTQDRNTPGNKTPNNTIWKTPEITRKLETIVNVENITDPKETLKQELTIKNIDGSVKTVKSLKNGGLILESHNDQQQKKLRQALDQIKDIKDREQQTTDPMFNITGVEKGMHNLTNEEFIQEVITQNADIEEELGVPVADKIRFIAEKACINI